MTARVVVQVLCDLISHPVVRGECALQLLLLRAYQPWLCTAGKRGRSPQPECCVKMGYCHDMWLTSVCLVQLAKEEHKVPLTEEARQRRLKPDRSHYCHITKRQVPIHTVEHVCRCVLIVLA